MTNFAGGKGALGVLNILRWEPVFRGERRKLILDRARLYALYYIVKRGISNDKSKKLT